MDMSMIITDSKADLDLQLLEEFGHCRRALSHHFNNALRPLGLSAKQGALLRFLSKRGKACLADLSRDTMTDPAAMTKMTNLLLKQGLVRQGEHPTDKRRWVLALTPRGGKLASRAEEVYLGLAGEILKVLGPAEKHDFSKILQKLTGHLEKHLSVPINK